MAKQRKRKRKRSPIKQILRKPEKPPVKPPRRFARANRSKLIIAFSVLVVAMAGLIIRLSYINATSGDKYKKLVLSQLNYDGQTIPFRRGDITDRNGTVIATSEKVYNLILDPYVMLNSKVNIEGDCVDTSIDILEEYFGITEETVREILKEKPESRYVIVTKQLTYDQVNPYNELMESEEEADTEISKYVKGIWFEEDYLRRYPYSTLACDLIGFTVAGNVGNYGIEQYYDSTLNGTDGRVYGYLTDDSSLERTTIPAVNGNTVVSTIDVNINRIIEKHISDFNQAIGSENTAVIVMDPNSGEILGMASYPVYDLNNPRDLTNLYTQAEIDAMDDETTLTEYYDLWKNFCISQTYEPGSTAKTMTVAAALDESVASDEDTYYCSGSESYKEGTGSKVVTCNSTHGTVTLTQSLMKSCNSAMMQIAGKMGVDTFVCYQQIFGLGQLTNIDLPGEESATGQLYYASNMKPIDLGTNAFGQNYNVTMVQMAAAFSSIVNGGYYYKPHVVKEILSESGSVIEFMDKELVKTTISEETSAWMRDALLKTVQGETVDGVEISGTANLTYIEGYTIGAKTGTAEKKPIEDEKCLVSLISCAPAENPEVVVYVIIDEPNTNNQGDSALATIMSRKIYEDLLPYLQIFPTGGVTTDDTEPESSTESETISETDEYGNVIESDETTEEGETSESDTSATQTTPVRDIAPDTSGKTTTLLTDTEIANLRNEYFRGDKNSLGSNN